jgi:hypothetical protein
LDHCWVALSAAFKLNLSEKQLSFEFNGGSREHGALLKNSPSIHGTRLKVQQIGGQVAGAMRPAALPHWRSAG